MATSAFVPGHSGGTATDSHRLPRTRDAQSVAAHALSFNEVRDAPPHHFRNRRSRRRTQVVHRVVGATHHRFTVKPLGMRSHLSHCWTQRWDDFLNGPPTMQKMAPGSSGLNMLFSARAENIFWRVGLVSRIWVGGPNSSFLIQSAAIVPSINVSSGSAPIRPCSARGLRELESSLPCLYSHTRGFGFSCPTAARCNGPGPSTRQR